MYYLKKNPLKVFMLVVMPLITGGILTGLLAKFGIKLPAGIEKMIAALGGDQGPSGGGAGMHYKRDTYQRPLGALDGLATGAGGLGAAMGMAKMFI